MASLSQQQGATASLHRSTPPWPPSIAPRRHGPASTAVAGVTVMRGGDARNGAAELPAAAAGAAPCIGQRCCLPRLLSRSRREGRHCCERRSPLLQRSGGVAASASVVATTGGRPTMLRAASCELRWAALRQGDGAGPWTSSTPSLVPARAYLRLPLVLPPERACQRRSQMHPALLQPAIGVFAAKLPPGDCHDTAGNKDVCVVGAINNYTAALKDSNSPFNPSESLMFLAHFVGDVHQPMHCAHASDEGGNTILLHWYRRKSNLHHVWDVNVIEKAMKDFYDNDNSTMIEAIQSNITDVWSNEEKQWEACGLRTKTCAETYAKESALLACDAYEGVKQEDTLGDEYFFKALPVVQKRIAQGGVRLAAILNRIFSGKNRLQSS